MSAIDVDRLVARAEEARSQAYAPYSGYRVGAALLAADGTIVTGCNVENGSYGLTICAERTAVCRAVAEGRREFLALAIAASGERTPYPCGACRQVLAEFCPPGMPVCIRRADGGVEQRKLGDLLPDAFTLEPPHP